MHGYHMVKTFPKYKCGTILVITHKCNMLNFNSYACKDSMISYYEYIHVHCSCTLPT